MFDLITDTRQRPLRERSPRSKVVSMVGHAIFILTIVVIPLLQATQQMPPIVPTMLAFVAPVPVAPPPPPPPPPRPAAAPSRPATPDHTSGPLAAPIAAPSTIAPEPVARPLVDSTAGVLGGVEGGVPGGVVGGIVGGIVSSVPPPPPAPPAPPAVARGPVRIGGQVTAPALVRRVEPVYPEVAALAKLTGTVILEATVNIDGCVESVKVLRSRHALLDKASEEALLQWRYSPLVLNGTPTAFILTVTFTFSVS